MGGFTALGREGRGFVALLTALVLIVAACGPGEAGAPVDEAADDTAARDDAAADAAGETD
jgi:hypothetical protein